MIAAICSTGESLDAMADPRFGRCAYFLIVDTDTLAFEALQNSAAMQGSGAGIAAAQMVASKGVQAVVAGNYGPNAHQALSAGGIQLYTWADGTVRQAIEALKAGQLQPISAPSVQAHYGMAQGPAPGAGTGQGFGSGMNPGGGGGMGRGTGHGMGGGMGCGMGRGGGMGRGRGGR